MLPVLKLQPLVVMTKCNYLPVLYGWKSEKIPIRWLLLIDLIVSSLAQLLSPAMQLAGSVNQNVFMSGKCKFSLTRRQITSCSQTWKKTSLQLKSLSSSLSSLSSLSPVYAYHINWRSVCLCYCKQMEWRVDYKKCVW